MQLRRFKVLPSLEKHTERYPMVVPETHSFQHHLVLPHELLSDGAFSTPRSCRADSPLQSSRRLTDAQMTMRQWRRSPARHTRINSVYYADHRFRRFHEIIVKIQVDITSHDS